jgi:hypothetical protein
MAREGILSNIALTALTMLLRCDNFSKLTNDTLHYDATPVDATPDDIPTADITHVAGFQAALAANGIPSPLHLHVDFFPALSTCWAPAINELFTRAADQDGHASPPLLAVLTLMATRSYQVSTRCTNHFI